MKVSEIGKANAAPTPGNGAGASYAAMSLAENTTGTIKGLAHHVALGNK